jgi:Type II secretion system (T2SS), protein E, N-terminal domain
MESVLEDVRPARPGVTHASRPGGRTGFLSDVIVELGFIDAEASARAVEEGRVNGKAVTDVLLDAELISEAQLSRATAELHGLDHVDLGTFDVDLDVARLISRSAARRYGAVPIAFEDDGTLLIALADPVDPLAVDDISVMTKSEVYPMVATPSSIDAVIEQLSDAPSGPPPEEEPQFESAHGRPEAEADPQPEPAAEPNPQPEPAAEPGPQPEPPAEAAPDVSPARSNSEMALMRQALADLAARVESFTAAPAAPAAPAEPSVSLEEHDDVLARLQDAERHASDADGALEQLADAERRASAADGALERLEEAERRSKDAEAALAEIRGERDQERLRHQKAEQELCAQIESAKESTRRLEQRLSNVLAVTAEIRAACEKLISAESPS